MYTETLTQRLGISNGIAPQIINNATLTSGSVDLQVFRRALAKLYLGAVTGGGSINAKWQESSDNATFTDLANGLANISQTGLTTANKIVTFEVRADQIAKRYVRLSITETGSQNVNVAVDLCGDEAAHKPGNANNGANVSTQNVAA
jgi:hypothetical protein